MHNRREKNARDGSPRLLFTPRIVSFIAAGLEETESFRESRLYM